MRRKYITAEEAAKRWGITAIRVAQLCRQGRIEGAQEPTGWRIPEDADDPRHGPGRPRVSDPVRRREYHDQEQGQIETAIEPISSMETIEPTNEPKQTDKPDPLDSIRRKYQRDETENDG